MVFEKFNLNDLLLAVLGDDVNGVISKIEEKYKLDQTKFVLEPGCGCGKIGVHLALKHRCNVTLMDIDQQALIYANKIIYCTEIITGYKISVSTLVGNIMAIKYSADTFDLVYNEGVVEHWSGNERLKCISEMVRVSKDCVIIIVPDAEGLISKKRSIETKFEYKGVPEKDTPYTASELKLNMEKCGLKNVSVDSFFVPETQEFLIGVGWK